MQIEVYKKSDCPWCEKAINLLSDTYVERRGAVIHVTYIDRNQELREDLLSRVPTAKTVPQIFINGEHIGGYDDLVEYIDNTTSMG